MFRLIFLVLVFSVKPSAALGDDQKFCTDNEVLQKTLYLRLKDVATYNNIQSTLKNLQALRNKLSRQEIKGSLILSGVLGASFFVGIAPASVALEFMTSNAIFVTQSRQSYYDDLDLRHNLLASRKAIVEIKEMIKSGMPIRKEAFKVNHQVISRYWAYREVEPGTRKDWQRFSQNKISRIIGADDQVQWNLYEEFMHLALYQVERDYIKSEMAKVTAGCLYRKSDVKYFGKLGLGGASIESPVLMVENPKDVEDLDAHKRNKEQAEGATRYLKFLHDSHQTNPNRWKEIKSVR